MAASAASLPRSTSPAWPAPTRAAPPAAVCTCACSSALCASSALRSRWTATAGLPRARRRLRTRGAVCDAPLADEPASGESGRDGGGDEPMASSTEQSGGEGGEGGSEGGGEAALIAPRKAAREAERRGLEGNVEGTVGENSLQRPG